MEKSSRFPGSALAPAPAGGVPRPLREGPVGAFDRLAAVEASDPADTRDPIQFALPVGPSGMLISSEGVVTWATPTAGVHDVSVVVTDGDGGSARQNFRVTVVSGDARGPYVADEGATIQVRANCLRGGPPP